VQYGRHRKSLANREITGFLCVRSFTP